MSSSKSGSVTPTTDRRNSPTAGTGAGGTNYMQDAGYDSGTAVQGYMSTQQPLSTGEGYLSAPAGAGPGYGVQNEGSAHNTGYGATGAGTGTSGYRHGKGESHADIEVAGAASTRQDAHTMGNLLHLHRHKDKS